MTKRERAYNKRLKELIKNVGRLKKSEVRRVMALLNDAKKNVAAMIATTEWQAHYLPELKKGVEEAMLAFQNRYKESLVSAQSNMHLAGLDIVDAPIAYAGIGFSGPEISLTALEIMQGYSADLVTGLARDAIKKINQELTLGILGQKGPMEVMAAIGKKLSGPGVFGSIATRAETITRTETARVLSNSSQARMEQVAEIGTDPKIKWVKKWIHSGKANPRARHIDVDGETVPVGQNFSNGILYPHAPGLDASETVNCGCIHTMTCEDWEKLPKDFEERPYQERAIYN